MSKIDMHDSPLTQAELDLWNGMGVPAIKRLEAFQKVVGALLR